MKINLKLKQKIYFLECNLPYKVKAISDNFAICTRKINRKEDADLLKHEVVNGGFLHIDQAWKHFKGCPIYTILDFKKEKRGTHNLIFNLYDFSIQEDIDKCLEDLESGKIELSRRGAIHIIINAAETYKTI